MPQLLTGMMESYLMLYQRAFAEFGAVALWNLARLEHPTPLHALVVARALRIEGDLEARQLAEEIERVCSAEEGGCAVN